MEREWGCSSPRIQSHKRTPKISRYPIYPNRVIMLRRKTGWQEPCHYEYGPKWTYNARTSANAKLSVGL